MYVEKHISETIIHYYFQWHAVLIRQLLIKLCSLGYVWDSHGKQLGTLSGHSGKYIKYMHIHTCLLTLGFIHDIHYAQI